MPLMVLAEKEIPDEMGPVAEVKAEKREEPAPVMEAQSRPSSTASQNPHTVAVLMEIRKVLNARAGALLAMVGSFVLTAAAMVQGTPMSLAIALSYDLCVFLPIAVIAYRMPKG